MAMDAARVRDQLGRWTRPEEMLSQSLADGLGALVRRGDIPPGSRLPSRRQLGRALGVCHNTVGCAYELLQMQGLVDAGGTVAVVSPVPAR